MGFVFLAVGLNRVTEWLEWISGGGWGAKGEVSGAAYILYM
jgi:hypothetical protein